VRQATFDRRLDQIGCEKGERDVMLTLRRLHFSRAAICSTSVTVPAAISSSQWSAPAERSRWNVSLRLAVAPAWPAEPVGVAQPATRRMQAQTPLVLVACIRLRREA
jgi:hypothetical protein